HSAPTQIATPCPIWTSQAVFRKTKSSPCFLWMTFGLSPRSMNIANATNTVIAIATTPGIAELLVLMSLTGPFITSELNGDPIFLANRTLPAESHYDAVSAVVRQFIILIPFFLGRQLLRNSRDNEEILRVLAIAGLLYSLPMLFEIRM